MEQFAVTFMMKLSSTWALGQMLHHARRVLFSVLASEQPLALSRARALRAAGRRRRGSGLARVKADRASAVCTHPRPSHPAQLIRCRRDSGADDGEELTGS
jgi:hypothetical protein